MSRTKILVSIFESQKVLYVRILNDLCISNCESIQRVHLIYIAILGLRLNRKQELT